MGVEELSQQNVTAVLEELLNDLLDIYTGVAPWNKGFYFWRWLASRSKDPKRSSLGAPSTAEEVRDYLRCYGPTREDLRQELLILFWKKKKWGITLYKKTKKIVPYFARHFRGVVHMHMATWFFTNKVFQGTRRDWQDKYKIWISEPSSEEDDYNILSIFSAHRNHPRTTLFDQYLYYLWFNLKLNRPQIARILLTNIRQVERWKHKFYPKVKQGVSDAS